LLKDEELELSPGVPSGDCNIFDVCHIEPDGSVKPCCGGALTAPGLTAGKINSESLTDIIARMETEPFFKSLRAYVGPKHPFKTLREIGLGDFEKPAYTGTCHACGHLFSSPDIVARLRAALAQKSIELLAARWFAHDRHLLAPSETPATPGN